MRGQWQALGGAAELQVEEKEVELFLGGGFFGCSNPSTDPKQVNGNSEIPLPRQPHCYAGPTTQHPSHVSSYYYLCLVGSLLHITLGQSKTNGGRSIVIL